MSDFTMFAGDTKVLVYSVADGNGAAVDISGATAIRWALARRVFDTPILSKSLTDGIEITDGPAGEFEVSLDAEDTDALGGATYYHEAEVTLADGTVATVETGRVTITRTLLA